MGAKGNSIYFDLCERDCATKNRIVADFHTLSTCGNISSFYDCEIVKNR